jgi:hypothetical protein
MNFSAKMLPDFQVMFFRSDIGIETLQIISYECIWIEMESNTEDSRIKLVCRDACMCVGMGILGIYIGTIKGM